MRVSRFRVSLNQEGIVVGWATSNKRRRGRKGKGKGKGKGKRLKKKEYRGSCERCGNVVCFVLLICHACARKHTHQQQAASSKQQPDCCVWRSLGGGGFGLLAEPGL